MLPIARRMISSSCENLRQTSRDKQGVFAKYTEENNNLIITRLSNGPTSPMLLQNTMQTEICRVRQFEESQSVKTSSPALNVKKKTGQENIQDIGNLALVNSTIWHDLKPHNFSHPGSPTELLGGSANALNYLLIETSFMQLSKTV